MAHLIEIESFILSQETGYFLYTTHVCTYTYYHTVVFHWEKSLKILPLHELLFLQILQNIHDSTTGVS